MVRFLARCLPSICFSRKKRQSLTIAEQKGAGTKHHQEEVNKLFVRRVESIRVTQQGGIAKRLPLSEVEGAHASPSKKTKSKAALKKTKKTIKGDDTEFDCETQISEHPIKAKTRGKSTKKKSKNEVEPELVRSQAALEKLFKKTKSTKIPSPTPSSLIDQVMGDFHQSSCSLTSSVSSDWSTSTYSDSQSSEKSDEKIKNVQHRPSLAAKNKSMHPTEDDSKHRSCAERFYIGKEHVRSSSPTNQVKQRNSQAMLSNKGTEQKTPAKSKQVLENVRKMMKDQTIQDEHFQHARQRESVRL